MANPYRRLPPPQPRQLDKRLWWAVGIGCLPLVLMPLFVLVWWYLEPADMKAPRKPPTVTSVSPGRR